MEFTAEQIAGLVNGAVDGDGSVRVSTFGKIEEAGPGALTFLANPKYTHHIYDTKASAVLVASDFVAEQPVSATLIRVADPYETLARLMRLVDAQINAHPVGIEVPAFVAHDTIVPDDAYIGAFSYVAQGVTLGKGVKIYPQVYVGRGVTIGEDTVLYPGVKIYPGCVIGKRCIIHSGAVIGADGFGFAPDAEGHYSKIPQMGIAEIADDVEIGANTTIDRATMGRTLIGQGTKIDNLVQIAHNVTVGRHTVMAAQGGVAGSATIGDHCMLGGQVGVAGHITVGDSVQVGAQTGIPNNVADGSAIMGYPAVPARDFMRQAACMRRLPALFDDVAQLMKELGKQ